MKRDKKIKRQENMKDHGAETVVWASTQSDQSWSSMSAQSFGYPLKAHSKDSDQADHCVGLTSCYVFSSCFSQIQQIPGSLREAPLVTRKSELSLQFSPLY